MNNFDQAFDDLLGNEGGYTNNPKDPGGETNWGITAAVAHENGYTGEMRCMPKDFAKLVYAKHYWRPAFDNLPYAVAFQLFDGAVNSGPGQSTRWLQRAVGVVDDGVFGPKTAAAVAAMPVPAVVAGYNAERLLTMTSLPTWAVFGKGWARRIAGNLKKGVA